MGVVGYVILTLEFRKEGKRWVAHCAELGTSAFGRSLEEAKERLREAVLLHLNTLEDVGERERFLKEHKIKLYAHKPRFRTIEISLPLDEETLVQSHIQRIPDLIPA